MGLGKLGLAQDDIDIAPAARTRTDTALDRTPFWSGSPSSVRDHLRPDSPASFKRGGRPDQQVAEKDTPGEDGQRERRQSGGSGQERDEGGDGDQDESDDGDGAEGGKSGKKASRWPIVILIVIAVFVVIAGAVYWFLTRNDVSTDDAYTEGDAVAIAPHVAGYVVARFVNDNEFVKAGELMLQIDPRDYIHARDQARANLDLARAQLRAAEIDLAMSRVRYPSDRRQSEAQLDQARANQFKRRSRISSPAHRRPARHHAIRGGPGDCAIPLHHRHHEGDGGAAAGRRPGRAEHRGPPKAP